MPADIVCYICDAEMYTAVCLVDGCLKGYRCDDGVCCGTPCEDHNTHHHDMHLWTHGAKCREQKASDKRKTRSITKVVDEAVVSSAKRVRRKTKVFDAGEGGAIHRQKRREYMALDQKNVKLKLTKAHRPKVKCKPPTVPHVKGEEIFIPKIVNEVILIL